MEDCNTNNKRIAKNAIMLYLRMFLTMVVGIYTSRVVLNVLGVEDYGIYNVVGGIVGFLSFLNGAMSSATSRFMAYEMGRGNAEVMNKTFSSTMIVHITVALVILLLSETVGLWFLEYKLVIPEARQTAAFWVYQISILSAMLTITQVPYNASIIAHERMDVYAYVEILNVTLKLVIVYLLSIGNFDKLILYALLMLGVSFIVIFTYRIFCTRKFEECKFRFIWDKNCLKALLSYSSWNIYSNISVTFRQQGITFLINMFYGVVYNAANGLATMIEGMVKGFTFNSTLAFQPQIIKSFAQNDIKKMQVLLEEATIIGLFVQLVVIVPLMLESDFLLRLWLVEVPDMTYQFTMILLISTLFSMLNCIFIIPVAATGKIAWCSFLNGTINLLTCPLVYVLYVLHLGVEYAFYGVLLCNALLSITNLMLDKRQIPEIAIRPLIKQVLISIVLGIVCYYFAYKAGTFINNEYMRFFLTAIIIEILVVLLSYQFLFNEEIKKIAIGKIVGYYYKFKK